MCLLHLLDNTCNNINTSNNNNTIIIIIIIVLILPVRVFLERVCIPDLSKSRIRARTV